MNTNPNMPTTQIMPKWYIFYTKSRHEKKVYERLTEDGYEVYLPLWKTLRQWSQRVKEVEEPVFKSYIFVRSMEKYIFSILSDPSIVKVIRFHGHPATISEKHLELIQKMLKNKVEISITTEFRVGEPIKIKGGSFHGLNGTIHEVRGKKQFQVLLLGSNLLLTMPLSSISRED